MSLFYQELSKLVKDVYLFIRQDLEENGKVLPLNAPTSSTVKSQAPSSAQKPSSQPQMSVPEAPSLKQEQEILLSKSPEKIEIEIPKKPFSPKKTTLQFELQPLGPSEASSFDEMRSLLRKVAPRMKIVDPQSPLAFLVFDEVAEHIAFLEKVASAVSPLLGSAKLYKMKEKQPLPECRLFFAPLSCMKEVSGTIHQLTTFQKIPFFPLADPHLYLQDPSLKRALWNSLKTLPPLNNIPNMPPSS